VRWNIGLSLSTRRGGSPQPNLRELLPMAAFEQSRRLLKSAFPAQSRTRFRFDRRTWRIPIIRRVTYRHAAAEKFSAACRIATLRRFQTIFAQISVRMAAPSSNRYPTNTAIEYRCKKRNRNAMAA